MIEHLGGPFSKKSFFISNDIKKWPQIPD